MGATVDEGRSKTPIALDNARVNGNWKLIIENNTGKTLDLAYFQTWVDYKAPPDIVITDVDIVGTQAVGNPVLITTKIDNISDNWYSSPITLEYLVNGSVIGTSLLTGGLLPGDDNNVESELHSFTKIGTNQVTVRVKNGVDLDTSNHGPVARHRRLALPFR